MRSILRNAATMKMVTGAVIIALTGCGGFGGSGSSSGGSTTPPSSQRTPTQIAISSGDNQSVLKDTASPSPLVVLVTDAQGAPVSGVSVAFAVASGGGSLSAASSVTDSLGLAKSTLTVGPSAGPNTVTASAANAQGAALQGSPLTFHATATDTPPPPPPPATVTYVNDVAPILNAKCTSCHAPGLSSGNEPLDTYTAVTTGTTKQGYTPSAYVVAGNPSASLLMIKISGATQGSQMPVGSMLSAAEMKTISDWISQGAVQSPSGGAVSIQKTSGDNQTATAGGMLANPFVVTVLDASSKPVSGVAVTWAVASGGGSLSSVSASTDANGQAMATLTTGMTAGANTVTATSGGLTGSPITFTATGNPGPASKLALVSGDNQTGLVGKALTNPLVVKVTDMAGNGVAGTTVAFAVTTGGGSLSATSVATNGMGLAQATLTLGAVAGTNNVTATVSGLSGSPITFKATGMVGAPATLAIVSGDAQSGTAGAALSKPLVVVVKDASGNAVSGVSVSFAVTTGAGSLSAKTATTAANGQAQTTLTLDKVAGANKVTASVTGLTSVVFSETGAAGAATTIAKVSGDNQTQTAGQKLVNPFVVKVTDANGNAVANTAIAFAVTTGGGTLSGASTTTDTKGMAQATLTLGAASGTNTVTVSKTGLTSVVFTATGTATGAPTMSIVSGNNQTGMVGATLASALVIAIKDSTGVAVANKAVTFAVTAGGGTLSSVSATTDATGQAKATLKLGAAAGTNTVTCTATGVNMSPQTFTATATAGAAAKLVKVSGDAQTGVAGAALANPIVVQVQDAGGNPVANVTVNFAASAGTLSAASGKSDAAGKVSFTLTLAKTAGAATITASSTGLTSVTFSETGTAGAAASVAIVSGDAQTGTVGTALTNPLVVVVKDANANAISGATVTFAVTAGGGSLSARTATTSANGQASTVLTLGATAGANKVSATVGALTPVVFSETGTAVTTSYYYTTDIQPLLAAHCTVCHGPGGVQQNTPLDTYAHVTTGTTKYAYTPASYVVASNAAMSLIDAKLHGTAGGANMATQGGLSAAQVQMVRDWINQGAKQSSAGTPASLAKSAGDAQTGPAGTTLPTALQVLVKDASGNAVPGIAVSFAVTAGGGSLSAATATTDAAGHASVSLTLGATAGTNSVKASYGSLTPVTFTETGTASSYSGAPLTGSTNPIDIEALRVLKAANVEPAKLSSDDEFLRRVTADLLGRTPTETELTQFRASSSPSKRATVIDSHLASAEFATHWANDIFASWACIHTGTTSVVAFDQAVQAEIMKDTPVSTLVTDMITGGGTKTTVVDPAGNTLTWGQIWLTTFPTYGDTAQVDQLMLTFAGQTAECGRCHDHKLTVAGQDDPMWKQDDTYGLYAYVAANAGSATKVDTSGKRFGTPVPCHFVADGYTNEVDSTTVVNGTTVPMTVANTPVATRRAAFASIFIKSAAFARGTAHRIFAEVMDPLLDPNQFLAANLSGMKEAGLLGVLEAQFKAGNTSLKSFLRLICNSKLYQLTTAGTTTTNDAILARRTVRRHHSEVIEKATYTVTGATFTSSTTAFEQQFGYPLARQEILDRTDQVNIGQAFMLMNSPTSTNGLIAKAGATGNVKTLANQVTAKTITMDQAITTLFHDALGRDPSSTELTAIDAAINGLTPQVALEDVAVALTATSEFVSR